MARPRNPNIQAGSRRARGRTTIDEPTTRGEQIIVEMDRADLHFGVRLDIFRGKRDELTDAEACLYALALRYVDVVGYQKVRAKHPVRGEDPFTPAELVAIRAGTYVTNQE